MKKQFIACLLAPILLVLFVSFSRLATPDRIPAKHTTGLETNCSAPAPSNLTVTATTPTSISLAWVGPAASGVYYKIDIFDNTDSVFLSPVYTTMENTTVNSLTSEHCYTFWVSASYCSTGGYGDQSGPAEGCCGIIITDVVIEFSNPSGNPANANTTQNALTTICMPRSTQTNPFDEPAIVEIRYNNLTYRFGMGLEPAQTDNIYMYTKYFDPEFPFSEYFRVIPFNNNNSVMIRYGAYTDLLQIDYENSTQINAYLNATVKTNALQSFKIWDYCNAAHGMSTIPTPGHVLLPKELTPKARRCIPGPNPFSTSTSIYYTLEEDGPVDIRLLDSFGRQVKMVARHTNLAAGHYETIIMGEGLVNGVYFLQVQVAGQSQVYRLVKQD